MYFRPNTVPEACTLAVDHPHAALVGGGTILLAAPGQLRPRALIDLSALPLREIVYAAGTWQIGALCTLWQIGQTSFGPALRALQQAGAGMGPRAVARQASVGGNVCIGGSLTAPLHLLQATATVVSHAGVRTSLLRDLRLAAGELLVDVQLPDTDGESRYSSVRRTHLGPAIAAVAVRCAGPQMWCTVAGGGTVSPVLGPWSVVEPVVGADWQGWQPAGDPLASAQYRRALVLELVERERQVLANIF